MKKPPRTLFFNSDSGGWAGKRFVAVVFWGRDLGRWGFGLKEKGAGIMPKCCLGETEIYYRFLEGEGEVVTLICGHMRNLRDFSSLALFLRRAGHAVLTLDNRGAGKTQSAPTFTLLDMAHDVAAVWAELGIRSSHIVGFSMGGLIAQQVAALAAQGLC